MAESASGPILHVIVVGFHHKKGCQVSSYMVERGTPVFLRSTGSRLPFFFSVREKLKDDDTRSLYSDDFVR